MFKIYSQKFSLKEQTFFTKRLAFLITAGVPLVESLQILGGQMRRPSHAVILESIISDVSNGKSLSRSFARFPRTFSECSVQLVKIGEASGTLSLSLEYLADELQKRHTLRGKVISAFIYPALITLATLGITLFLTMYLIPKIMPIFSSLQMQLPLMTRIMLGVSETLRQWGLLLVFGAVSSGVGMSLLLKKSIGAHRVFDRIILRVPLFGRMIRFFNVASACRTLGLLLKSGVPLYEALVVTADTTRNHIYKEAYKRMAESVVRGEKISTHMLLRSDMFPDIAGHMVAVGERSGTLSGTLVYLSEVYDAEVDDFSKSISTLIEPVLMVVMGILVGFIALSIITPLYGITQNIHA